MQYSLIILWAFFAFSLIAVFVWMVRSKLKEGVWGLGKVFAVVLLSVISVVLAYYLYQQSTALSRLHSIGIRTPSSIEHVVGVANGTGAKPLWMFAYSGTENDLVAFYKNEKNRPGWYLIEANRNRLILRQKPVDLKILINRDTITFLLMESK